MGASINKYLGYNRCQTVYDSIFELMRTGCDSELFRLSRKIDESQFTMISPGPYVSITVSDDAKWIVVSHNAGALETIIYNRKDDGIDVRYGGLEEIIKIDIDSVNYLKLYKSHSLTSAGLDSVIVKYGFDTFVVQDETGLKLLDEYIYDKLYGEGVVKYNEMKSLFMVNRRQ